MRMQPHGFTANRDHGPKVQIIRKVAFVEVAGYGKHKTTNFNWAEIS